MTISHACATFCIHVPMLEVSAPNQSSRKLRWVRATAMRVAASLIRLRKEIQFYAIFPAHEESSIRPAAASWRPLPAPDSAPRWCPACCGRACRTPARQKVTLAMVNEALKLSGIEVSEDEKTGLVEARESQPGRLRRPAQAAHPARRVAAVPLQPGDAGHDGEQDEAAVPPERGAGGEASRESRRRGVLAGAPSRRAGSHAAGHLARADRDVSRAAASLQRRC